jgi:hypothetical protein
VVVLKMQSTPLWRDYRNLINLKTVGVEAEIPTGTLPCGRQKFSSFRQFARSQNNDIYIHTCMHACMHAYIHTYIHTYIHYTHTQSHIYYTHTD